MNTKPVEGCADHRESYHSCVIGGCAVDDLEAEASRFAWYSYGHPAVVGRELVAEFLMPTKRTAQKTPAIIAVVLALAIGGCGSTGPKGYLNMTTLAAHVKANAWFGPAGHRIYAISASCTKTGTYEAVCTPVYEEAKGPEAGSTFKEKIAPDGSSYKSEGPG